MCIRDRILLAAGGVALFALRRINKYALTALTASLEIGANHPQITYYFLLAMRCV